ncbi:MAG: ATP-grasp domain-containing protein [Candidatus Lokiarchaeota archaeon]|nr:ATP-grasp domain-containing protein [Candidatus Lokiarchaeota archaeon]
MFKNKKSILVVGFNTRPLVYSLYRAGFKVYTVDFFGDLDLYPYVEDYIIITKRTQIDYNNLKDNYKSYLIDFTFDLLEKYPNINYLLIGSGLDDSFIKRKLISEKINSLKNPLKELNNKFEILQKSRDILEIYQLLRENGYNIPLTKLLNESDLNDNKSNFPFILKKKQSSGGINIYKINNQEQFYLRLRIIKNQKQEQEWLVQEYIEGSNISCTVIANGIETNVISINQQIIGFGFLNAPEEYTYCGNIVPTNIIKKEMDTIKNLSIFLSNTLGLTGINGFDFVIRNNIPYLMEINPRIPGSIRVSEEYLTTNLLKLHIDSFFLNRWNSIKKSLTSIKKKRFCTKLIFFAPKDLSIDNINKINKLKHIHDKTEPLKKILKYEPVCTILFKDNTFINSYFGALKIVNRINKIIF